MFNNELLDCIKNFAKEKIVEAIQSKKWKELFVKTGDLLLKSPDIEEDFVQDLQLVFSEDNMSQLALELNHSSGIGFIHKLHKLLKDLFHKYELDDQADTYISNFVQSITNYMAENDPQKHLATFISEWKEINTKQLNRIEGKEDEIIQEIKKISRINTGIYKISDFQNRIKKYAKYEIDLSFFDWDDDQFAYEFNKAINQKDEMIVIEGKSREETLYRVLNYLNTHFSEESVYIIKDESTWNELQSTEYTDKILIPFIYSESLNSIKNNINIFIHGDDEPSRRRDKIILRKRTKRNIIHALEEAKIPNELAYKMFEKTHGIYAPMKRLLFNEDTMQPPTWASNDTDVIIAALLCGKWMEYDGDKKIIEQLSGKKYNEFISIIKKYKNGEEPFIIESVIERRKIYQIGSIEEAWVLLRRYITDDKKDSFIRAFCEILKQPDSKPRNSLDYTYVNENNLSNWSKVLKSGMIRSFILWTCIDATAEDQVTINYAVRDILNSIDTREKWEYIADYIVELCEAAPESVITRLENELKNPTGLQELFSKNTQYTSILWAVEQLIQQEPYIIRAIKWLWEMDAKNYKYQISNSPASILKVIFCAWFNVTPLHKADKIREAEKAINLYENAWDIIASNLPEMYPTIMSSLSKPIYKDINDFEGAETRANAYDVYCAYIDICANNSGNNVNKWEKVLDKTTYYEEDIIKRNLILLQRSVCAMKDNDKAIIKEKLREIVNQHRHFCESDWAMPESRIMLFENKIEDIVLDNPVYDYLYLFHPYYDFPLLHPIPYEKEEVANQRDKNEEMVDEERFRKIKEFKDKGYSLQQLIEYGMEREKPGQIGLVLAKYYDLGDFNENTFKILLHNTNHARQAVDYARYTLKNNTEIKMIVDCAKKERASTDIITDLISLQIAVDIDNTIIFCENDEIKKEYWAHEYRLSIAKDAPQTVLRKALSECFKWGSAGTYSEMLFIHKNMLTDEELYQLFIQVMKMDNILLSSSHKWDYEQILEHLQKAFIDNENKCVEIAKMEWWAGDIIDWESMRCTERIIKHNPQIYAELVNIVCKKDEGAPEESGKRERATRLYSRFRDIHFCPAETDGIVEYNEIKKWVDDFIEILKSQNQSSIWDVIVGELLPYSPIDEDGHMPCKAVRKLIENYYTEEMARSYATTVFNMRGVYSPDGGRGEMRLAEKYEENAKHLEREYPHTASIYRDISNTFKAWSVRERKEAEDELC